MSFILDALRKSEHERQRGAVPGISQVPLAARRHGAPRWTLGLIGVLALAVIALAAAWWHTLRSVPSPKPAAPPPQAASTAPPELPPVQNDGGANAERRASALPLATATDRPTSESAAVARDAARRDGAPLERSGPPSSPQAQPPTAAPADAELSAVAPAEARGEDAPTLPSAAALAAEGIAVPELRLELHAYSDNPAERFVFINGRKYTEGDTLVEGPRVVSIDTNGAVLSQQGHRFLLPTQ